MQHLFGSFVFGPSPQPRFWASVAAVRPCRCRCGAAGQQAQRQEACKARWARHGCQARPPAPQRCSAYLSDGGGLRGARLQAAMSSLQDVQSGASVGPLAAAPHACMLASPSGRPPAVCAPTPHAEEILWRELTALRWRQDGQLSAGSTRRLYQWNAQRGRHGVGGASLRRQPRPACHGRSESRARTVREEGEGRGGTEAGRTFLRCFALFE